MTLGGREVELGHSPLSSLVTGETPHFIRSFETFAYNGSSWSGPSLRQISYGCDWTLCNTPRLRDVLVNSLRVDVSRSLLSALFVPAPSETLTECYSCGECLPDPDNVPECPAVPCNGTCLVEDLYTNPDNNDGTCFFVHDSSCVDNLVDTSIELTATYYVDEKYLEMNEVDIYCRKNRCNSVPNIDAVQKNATATTLPTDQLFIRPNVTGLSTPPPNTGLIACYQCGCIPSFSENNCSSFTCQLTYENASYCELARDFEGGFGPEQIVLDHVRQEVVPFKHYVAVSQWLVFEGNGIWATPQYEVISYICDWEACNDPRIVSLLTATMKLNIEPEDAEALLESETPLTSCFNCSIYANSTSDFDSLCEITTCESGRCLLEYYALGAEESSRYAFDASCEPAENETMVGVSALYNIDGESFSINYMYVYCEKDGCNHPNTTFKLEEAVVKDIELDDIFFFRPVTFTPPPMSSTIPTTSTNTIISSSSTTSSNPTTSSSSITSTNPTTSSSSATSSNPTTSSSSTTSSNPTTSNSSVTSSNPTTSSSSIISSTRSTSNNPTTTTTADTTASPAPGGSASIVSYGVLSLVLTILVTVLGI